MTTAQAIIYEMATELEEMTEEQFLEDATNEYQGVTISCENADIVSHYGGAVEDVENNVIYWENMVINYDPYEAWEAEEL